ncbi:acyl--CoA ligase [Nocardia cyriacigeorgica]|uniref:Acyl--CoA ligase n=1 Tax=Nocardia cyriacigeorgica TaxID=135487 RepID=A0A5R8P7Z1_9NOCA|nr:class I adenylate-forming enzyme family protein [Nocardia cyriacigeorgica]TLF98254.1 acyl--CoA ligase [Nocardia cyriacigeorgica]
MTTPTIDALIRAHAAATPARPMVIDPSARITYGELDTSTRAFAATLVARGIGKGTRVGLIMPNCARWVQISMSLARIGAVLVPLSTLLTGRELLAQLRAADVTVLISVEEFRGHRYLEDLSGELGLESLPTGSDPLFIPRLPTLRSVWRADEIVAEAATAELEATVDGLMTAVRPADPMVIIFTSGSSGPPKGVLHSHGGALKAVESGLAARCIDADTRLYLPMPFFWVGGFGAGILSALIPGATLVTEQVPDPPTTLRLLERERVTLFRGWPDQAEALARVRDSVGADLSALRPGSLEALLPPTMRSENGSRANLFGMTESFGPYCGYPADTDMPRSAWGSCGLPFLGVEVRIVDREHGRPVPPETVGEIQLRGPRMMLGICGRTRESVFTPDGFYPTGDLGRLDADGFLFHHGRADDMVKVSGATVYPSEVRAALHTIDGVRAAFVTDIDGPAGARVAAAVVGEPGLTIEELRAAAKRALSSFKIPTVWLLLSSDETIPRGPTGKVDVRALRELLLRADSVTNQNR